MGYYLTGMAEETTPITWVGGNAVPAVGASPEAIANFNASNTGAGSGFWDFLKSAATATPGILAATKGQPKARVVKPASNMNTILLVGGVAIVGLLAVAMFTGKK